MDTSTTLIAIADFFPTPGNILAKPVVTDQLKSGFFLAGDKNPQSIADVISVGHGVTIKPGQTVIYEEYQPAKVTVDEEEYIVLKESDILLVRGKKAEIS